MKQNNYGKVCFDSQMAELLDSLLSVRGLKVKYRMRDESWIDRIEDPGLQIGIKHMSERQMHIVEKLILEEKHILDILGEEGISMEEFNTEIYIMVYGLRHYI